MEAVKEEEHLDSESDEYSGSEDDDEDDEQAEGEDGTEATMPNTTTDKETSSPSAIAIPLDNPGSSLAGTLETLKMSDSGISDLSDSELSRSPPQSRRDQELLEEENGKDTQEDSENHKGGIKDIVASDITKKRAQQQRKYHSKRSTRHAGRAHGSKAKQDTRVKLSDHGGFWG